jgi:hypothetical protein
MQVEGRDQHHPDLSLEEGPAGSDRSFGLLFAGVFALVGAIPLISGREPRWWALAPTAAFLCVALLRPIWLQPLNRLWFQLGKLLHRIVTPIVLGLMFFATFTPIAMVARALGRDPLRLRFDREATSYWILREPPGPAPDSFKNQF